MNKEQLEQLKNKVSSFEKEDLVDKFIKIYLENKELKTGKPIEIDFTDKFVKRRVQYIFKNYTNNVRAFQNLLNEVIENKDKDLTIFITNEYLKGEKKAHLKKDLPRENFPLKLKF
jgi:hypothetical protein